jgi:hypothetical protein
MDFPSEATKKEKRSLLATGFAGIVISIVKVFPPEIDVLGMKLISPNLPFVAVGALCVINAYLLIKFFTSYRYEWSQAEVERLVDQIRQGKTTMDLGQEEEGLKQQSLDVIEKRTTAQKQEEHESNRLAAIENKIKQADIKFQESQKES